VPVSDLHCAARIIVARHAKADFVESWFSDEGGSLTTLGRAQARDLGEALAGERLTAVVSSDTSRAVQTAEIVAARSGLPVSARKALREVFIGDLLGQEFDVTRIEEVSDRWHAGDLDARFPGGESGHDVVRRHLAELDELADTHRGECVLLVGHQTALAVVLHTLVGGSDSDVELANGAHVVLERDADGWRRAP
jgi:probable phosphoglycerate mutase